MDSKPLDGPWFGTNVITDNRGNVFPPSPSLPVMPADERAEIPYPADEVLHLFKSLVQLWQPPVWHTEVFAPVAATPYKTPPAWYFQEDGLWMLTRMTLMPWNARTQGEAPTAATYPTQVLVTVPGVSQLPFRLDSTHFDIRDMRVTFMNGAQIIVENVDTTNPGVVFLEFEQVKMPDYTRSGQ